MRSFRRCLALVVAGLLALPTSARAADPRAADAPLAVPVPDPAPPDMPEGPAPPGHVFENMPEGPAPAPAPVLAPGAALQRPDDVLGVAIGLGPTAPGTAPERQLLDLLERTVGDSNNLNLNLISPRTRVRRLRPGVGEGRQLCRERRDDLVILVEYLPDRPDPVLLAQDCRLDRALGVRGADAAGHPELIAALWAEHEDLLRQGVKERRRGRLGPKVRTGLVVGGAILAIGVAIGVVIAASLRSEIVVLTVSP